jgi:hypothetical protein
LHYLYSIYFNFYFFLARATVLFMFFMTGNHFVIIGSPSQISSSWG